MPYIFFDSPFVTPIIPIIAKYTDSIKADKDNFDENCKQFYKHLTASIMLNYLPDNFQSETGNFFPEMLKNTDLYIEPGSQELKAKLVKLRRQAIKLVLITASHIDFTELLMNYGYGDNWREYFDVVCCRAKKPGFFTFPAHTRPFYQWVLQEDKDIMGYGDEATDLNKEGATFLEGHWTIIDKWVKCNADKPGRVAYVGDSFKSDIVPTKMFSSWDLIAIILEGRKYKNKQENESSEPLSKKRHVDCWGSFFGDSACETLMAGKLMSVANVVLSDVEVFAEIDLDTELSGFYDFNPYN